MRNAINAGELPGPRMRAASPELVATGGLGDERQLHLHRESFALIADGPEEIRRAVRTCIREGVDNIKLNVSGDDFYPHAPAGCTTYMDDEVRMACEIAHEFGKQVATHSRSANSVKLSVRNGVDCIYHCEFADEEALDMMEAAKDRIFLGPAVGLLHNTVYEAAALGHHRPRWSSRWACAAISRRRPRSMPRSRSAASGSWSAATTASPGRRRAPMPATSSTSSTCSATRRWTRIVCATRWGGELMRMGGELGQVREGYLADLLLVDGNPLADIGDHGRPEPVRHDHEGRRDLQGSAGLCP